MNEGINSDTYPVSEAVDSNDCGLLSLSLRPLIITASRCWRSSADPLAVPLIMHGSAADNTLQALEQELKIHQQIFHHYMLLCST
jgi:hypothetical protein